MYSLQTGKPKVVYQAAGEDDPRFSEPTPKLPSDAKSAVCDLLLTAEVETIIGGKTTGPQITIADTKTSEGLVSGCMFVTKESSASSARYISIVTRTFAHANEATNGYKRLTKSSTTTKWYSSDAKQLITISGASLSTITASQTRGSDREVEAILTKIAELL